MKNLLIFAGIAGIAAAIAIYFTTESVKSSSDSRFVTDADILEYDINENTSAPQPVPNRGFNAMS
jgi:hypothetical protein